MVARVLACDKKAMVQGRFVPLNAKLVEFQYKRHIEREKECDETEVWDNIPHS